MAKRKEIINGLHNIFSTNESGLYDVSTFTYEQSVDENTVIFAKADTEDIGKFITINGESKSINENDNFIITGGLVFSGNGGGGSSDGFMKSDGSNYIASLNLVSHSITPTWTIKNQSGDTINTSEVSALVVENGAKVDFYGEWKYEPNDNTTKLPESCSGNWGIELPEPNVAKTYATPSITTNTTFSQTISAQKGGLEVKNGKVVKAEGNETNTKSVSVTFKPRIYYGASASETISSLNDLEELQTELNTTFAKTFNANCTGGKYIYVVYPSSITGEPYFKINGLDFTGIEKDNTNIINEYDFEVNYNIYRVSDIQTGASIPVIITKK